LYAELLAKDPHAPTPSHAAPPIVSAFLRAKQRLYSSKYVKLTLGKVSDGTLEVLLVDPWQRADVLFLVEGEVPRKRQLAVEDPRTSVARGVFGRRSRIEAQSRSGEILATLDLSLVRAPMPSTEAPALALSDAPAGGLATA